jgi:dolichol kinase
MQPEILADIPGAITISGAILLLFVVAELIRRSTTVPTEYTRKLTHVGAGVIVMTFPWLLNSPVIVGLLALGFFGILVIGKATGLLSCVHDIERRTSGAYYYPFAVFGTFWLANGDALLFCVPIAVMALADTAAALVGRKSGEIRYRVMDNSRSLEGSLSFFGLALLILLVGMGIAGAPGWPAMLIVALVAAVLCTATEAISVRGADNLFIPYACFLVLDRTLRLGLRDLSGWVEGMLLGLVVVVLSYRRASLTPAGSITLFIVLTLSWALGGWTWAVPLLSLFALYLTTAPQQSDRVRADLEEVFPTTVGAMLIVLAFGHFNDASLFVPYLATLAASGAIALSRMATVRTWPRLPLAISGAMVPVLPVLAFEPDVPVLIVAIAAAAGCAAFAALARTSLPGRRMVAALLAGSIAWAAAPL